MARIIIEYDEKKFSGVDALALVAYVVMEGKISEAAGIPHYCWLTTWSDGSAVTSRRKRTGNSADSFFVSKRIDNA